MSKLRILSSLGLVLVGCQSSPRAQLPAAASTADGAAGGGARMQPASTGSSALTVGTSAPASRSNATTSAVMAAASGSGAAAPGSNIDAAPGSNTGAAPGSNTSAAPGSNTSAAPGSNTGAAPGSNTGAAPGSNTSAAPGSDAAAPGSTTAAMSCTRPERYARANRVALDLSWPETLVWAPGSDQFVAWLKSTYQTQPDGTTLVESRPCGAIMPVMTSTDFVGGLKSSTQIPFSAFESPSLPTLHSTLRLQPNTPETRDMTMVLGASLRDPQGPWPMGSELMPADDDADGAPGMTVLPAQGPEFLEAPTSVSQLEFIDRLYIATRSRVTITTTPTCNGMSEGQVEPIAFDTSVVGCHVKDRDECTAEELRFVTTQNPRFKLGQGGSWVEADVPLDASCETVRATLP